VVREIRQTEDFGQGFPGGGDRLRECREGFQTGVEFAHPLHLALALPVGIADMFQIEPAGGVVAAAEFDDIGAHLAEEPPVFRPFGSGCLQTTRVTVRNSTAPSRKFSDLRSDVSVSRSKISDMRRKDD